MNPRPSPITTPHVPVGVLGARSLVGRYLVPLLIDRGQAAVACSRSAKTGSAAAPGVAWCRPGEPLPGACDRIPIWIAICPIQALPEWFGWLESLGIERLVALSSTSLITKAGSQDPQERRLVERLAEGEAAVQSWSTGRGVTATILRPTMIYDGVHDRNVATIAAVVRRLGWFPLCGRATGLRQPVHADDVAAATVSAAFHPLPRSVYTLSGGESLPFHDLVARTCRSHGLPARSIRLPAWAWRACFAAARKLGLSAEGSAAMGRRMNDDLVFQHEDASVDLGFRPRPFVPLCPDGILAGDLNPAADPDS